MRPARLCLLTLLVATLGVSIWVFWLHAAHLQSDGGLRSFDSRVGGYTLADARDYLAGLDPGGYALYQGLARWLDLLFPALLGLSMGVFYWRVTSYLNQWSRLVLLLFPSGYVLMDLCENALIQEMLAHTAAHLDPETVSLASHFTITKFVLLAVSLLAGLLLRVLRPR